MYKNRYALIGCLVVLLLSAPLCRAQRILKPLPKASRLAAARHAGLRATSHQSVYFSITPIKKITLQYVTQNPEALAIRIERQIAFKELNDKLLAKAKAAKEIQIAQLEAAEKQAAANTVIGSINVSSQPGPMVFRGVQLDVLNPHESVVMGAAYNKNGFYVTSLSDQLSSGRSITIGELEKGLPGYGITRVVIVVRMPATQTTPKKLRIVDYNVESGQITTSERF